MRPARRAVVILLCQSLRQAATITLTICLVRMLGERDKDVYGTYRQLELVLALLVGLCSLHLDISLYYFVPRLDPHRRGALMAQTFGISLATAAVIGAAMFCLAGPIAALVHNPALAPLLRVYCLYPIADLIVAAAGAFLINVDRPAAGGMLPALASAGKLAIVLTVLGMGFGLAEAVWAVVVYALVLAAAAVAVVVRECPPRSLRIDRALVAEQLRYALPVLVTGMIGVAAVNYDKALISVFFDPRMYAVYAVGAMQLPVVSMVLDSIAAAVMPQLVGRIDAGDPAAGMRLWQDAVRKGALIVLPCFVLFLIVAADLLVVMYGAGYALAAWPFAVYLLLLPLRIVSFGWLIRATGRTRPIAVSAAAGLVTNVLVSTVLVVVGRGSLLGFVGPCVGTVAAQLVTTCFHVWYVARLTGLPARAVIRWKELGSILLLCATAAMAVMVLPLAAAPPAVRAGLRAGLFAVLTVGMALWTRILLDSERAALYLPVRAIGRALRLGRGRTRDT